MVHNDKKNANDDEDAVLSDSLSGLDEIENAFDRVSMMADALLDSIRDDSLRGKARRREKKKQVLRGHHEETYESASGDDDDDSSSNFSEDDSTNNTASPAVANKKNNTRLDDYVGSFASKNQNNNNNLNDSIVTQSDDDCSTLDGDSIDGSLVHDMKNLNRAARKIQEELLKEGEAFQQASADAQNMKAWLEARADAKTPKIEHTLNLNLSSTNNNTKPPLVIHKTKKNKYDKSNRNSSSRSSSSATAVPPGAPAAPTTMLSAAVETFQTLCTDVFGKNSNIPLLIVTMLVWCLHFWMFYGAKNTGLVDNDGKLVPIGSLVDFS